MDVEEAVNVMEEDEAVNVEEAAEELKENKVMDVEEAVDVMEEDEAVDVEEVVEEPEEVDGMVAGESRMFRKTILDKSSAGVSEENTWTRRRTK